MEERVIIVKDEKPRFMTKEELLQEKLILEYENETTD